MIDIVSAIYVGPPTLIKVAWPDMPVVPKYDYTRIVRYVMNVVSTKYGQTVEGIVDIEDELMWSCSSERFPIFKAVSCESFVDSVAGPCRMFAVI